MLYGEDGSAAHTSFKNANGGVGVFVRSRPVTGGVAWGGHTYVLSDRASNYWEAERQAMALGGHLVSITSQAEEDWVYSTFLSRRGRTFWIGLNREYEGGPFARWRSGEKYAFSAWNPGEPNNAGGHEACTHILDNNRWNDLPCHYALQGIIEIDNNNVFNNHRYVLTSRPLNFADAERQAIAMGGHLTAVNDPEEMAFIEQRFRARVRQHLWIGLERPAPHAPFQRWTAGDKLDYSNWNPGEPNDWGRNEACTHVLAWNSKWNDINCASKFFGVIEIPMIVTGGGGSGGAAAIALQSGAPAPNPTSTTLQWRLNGAVNDLSGNGLNAYLAGSVAWKNDAPAGPRTFLSATPSLYLNQGASPQVYHPLAPVPHLSGDAAFTVMVWALYDNAAWPSDWIGVFGTTPTADVGNYNNGVGLALYQGNLCMQFYGTEVTAKSAIQTKQWYHLAATKAAGTVNEHTRLYVNGDEVAHVTRGPNGAPSIIPAPAMLGRSGDFNVKTLVERYFHGYLKDARIYPSALPATSIKQIYNAEW
jgi:hypothetical protein